MIETGTQWATDDDDGDFTPNGFALLSRAALVWPPPAEHFRLLNLPENIARSFRHGVCLFAFIFGHQPAATAALEQLSRGGRPKYGLVSTDTRRLLLLADWRTRLINFLNLISGCSGESIRPPFWIGIEILCCPFCTLKRILNPFVLFLFSSIPQIAKCDTFVVFRDPAADDARHGCGLPEQYFDQRAASVPELGGQYGCRRWSARVPGPQLFRHHAQPGGQVSQQQ